jgi:hypothetical protein
MNPVFSFRGAAKGGGGRAAASQSPKTEIKKINKGFVDIMPSKVLCDFLFSRNQPPKSADD